jgi:hypothetical protein
LTNHRPENLIKRVIYCTYNAIVCSALQNLALAMPDPLTVQHAWKDEKKPREYSFDSVFGPDTSQEEVSCMLAAEGFSFLTERRLTPCKMQAWG